MPNPHCTCDHHSDIPGPEHAPSCPLVRFPLPRSHEAVQHEAAFGRAERDPPDIVGTRPVPVLPALPEGAADRKAVPLVSGLLDYFPAALMAVAAISKVGNDQHNPGQPLHWERPKSGDEADALLRHLVDRGLIDTDGARHSAKVAWRALALLQKELEEAGEAPISRGSWA